MTRRTLLIFWTTAACGLGGCVAGSPGSSDETDADIAQYSALQTKLEANRSMFKPTGAVALAGIGNRLFWLDFDTDSPGLHSYNSPTGMELDYKFGIGDADDYNYRADDVWIVTAEPNGGEMHAYPVDDANGKSVDLAVAPTGDDVKWWAYATDHNDVYYVTTGDVTAVHHWTPATGSDTILFNLEDLGVKVGEFEDLGVSGGVMVFIESGRMWSLDLATKQPIPLDNATQARAAVQNTDGVLALTATGPFWFDYSTHHLRDVATRSRPPATSSTRRTRRSGASSLR